MAKQPIQQHLIATNINRLHLRNGYYYLRARVPSDLKAALPQPYTGKREIKISLKTRDRVQALSLFSMHSSCIDQIFASTRFRLLTGIQLQLLPQTLPVQTPQQVATEAAQALPASSPMQRIAFEYLVKMRVNQMRIDRRAEKSIEEFQGKMNVFIPLFKARLGSRFNEDLSAIQYDDVAAVLSKVQSFQHKGKTIGPRTAYAYGIALASLFKFGVQQRYLKHSCMPKLVKPKEMKRSASGGVAGWRPLGEPEIQKLLSAIGAKEIDIRPNRKKLEGCEALFRMRTLLALHSGLRIEEICSLRCSDLQEHDGVTCISVNELYGKHVKSTSSLRLVPLHLEIRDELLQHRDQMLEGYTATAEDNQLLWPDVKPYRGKFSAAFSKQFGRFLRKHVSQDKMHVFHSLRKNFAHSLQRASVQRELVGELLGHSDQSVTSLYTGGYDVRAKAEAIQLLKF